MYVGHRRQVTSELRGWSGRQTHCGRRAELLGIGSAFGQNLHPDSELSCPLHTTLFSARTKWLLRGQRVVVRKSERLCSAPT